MEVDLAEPLAAGGGTLELVLEWSFQVPENGADRHGITNVQQGTIYQLAQWYPRMYVYDDVNGWNTMPYLGQGEYYLEYGTFNVNITVPRGMIVAATGRLQNPGQVLTETQRERLQAARSSQETTMIIDSTEVGSPATRPDGSGPLTWRYEAESVRDFAWAASDAFIWDAARAEAEGEAVLAQSYYPKEGLGTEESPGWERSTEYVQHSIEFYSDFVAPYPYPNAINIAGRVLGMEYPQVAFCRMDFRGRSLFGVTDHEFGHTWFPMVVGSDERRWVWMDEGLNTFMNQYSEDAFYEEATTQSLRELSEGIGNFLQSPYGDQPVMTYADRMRSRGLGPLAYNKPANGLMLLREHVLGPDRFDSAFKEYFDRWAYRHPKPADFFRTVEEVSGEDLDWFWRSWFYETDVADPAIASVDTAATASDTASVTIEQNGELMLPVPVRLTFRGRDDPAAARAGRGLLYPGHQHASCDRGPAAARDGGPERDFAGHQPVEQHLEPRQQ
jgi:Aminopeptidase N